MVKVVAQRIMRPGVALLLSAGVLGTTAATAKDFKPGDLRVCNAKRCIPIMNRVAAQAFAYFIYKGPQPAVARSPRVGAPSFDLRFKNGYAAGRVASAALDRFQSYGVVCGRFREGVWYRLPARAVLELRRLTASLKPLRLPAAVPRSC